MSVRAARPAYASAGIVDRGTASLSAVRPQHAETLHAVTASQEARVPPANIPECQTFPCFIVASARLYGCGECAESRNMRRSASHNALGANRGRSSSRRPPLR